MGKNLWTKGLVIGMILLFIGISSVPIIASITFDNGTTNDNNKDNYSEMNFTTEKKLLNNSIKYPTGALLVDPSEVPQKPFPFSQNKPALDIPPQFDWRNYNNGDWTTPIRNQDGCGSCWAFAAVGALESIINIRSASPNFDIDLSEQYILSCLPLAGSCDGGYTYYAFQYIMDNTPNGNYHNGIIPESCLPYQADDTIPCSEKCDDWVSQLTPIKDYGILYNPSIAEIKQILVNDGPVAAHMTVYSDFYNYDGGIYTHQSETVVGGHAVVIVGYNDSLGYWICKNSWGTSWGEDGWFKIAFGDSNIGIQIYWVDYEQTLISVNIHRIKAIDIIDYVSTNWFYDLSICDDTNWTTVTNFCPAGDDIIINYTNVFELNSLTAILRLKLMDDDPVWDDLADVSGYPGGGVDDSTPDLRGAIFYGYYDLINNSLTGDITYSDGIYRTTCGDYPPDNSITTDENDAKVWFIISDNYELPIANAGPNRSIGLGEIVAFNAIQSTASEGSTLISYEWDWDNNGIYDEIHTVPYTFHTWTDIGNHTVSLRVRDNYNKTSIDFCLISIHTPGSIVAWGRNDYGQCNVPSPNFDFIVVDGGSYHSLGLKNDSIVAWGLNSDGQCNVPNPNIEFVDVVAKGFNSLGLKIDGSIVVWGNNQFGQCNVPSPNANFVGAAGGGYHNLGLKINGSIVSWGLNSYGQSNVPNPNTDFIAVSAGYYHSLALKADGSIVAWGRNFEGQCNVPNPNADFIAIAAGGYFNLGLKRDGSVVAWGNNINGQCNVPSPNTNFIAIAAGGYHSIGLKSDGSIICWGRNDYGQCNVPSPNTNFTAVAAGGYHSLGIRMENRPPNIPSNPNPPNGTISVPININLNWISGDPDQYDIVTYDVYFGSTNPPPLLMSNQSTTTYDPGTLDYNQTYYWKILAHDNHGESAIGPIWVFTTELNTPPIIGNPTPSNGSVENPMSLTWSVPINDSEGDTFSWMIQCNNGQTNSGTGATNGTKSLFLLNLFYSTTYTVWVNATDPYGSSTFTRRWYIFTTLLDTTPPITTLFFNGTLGGNSWYISQVIITLTSIDDVSGVDYTMYKIDSNNWHTYTDSIIISDDEEHTIEYYSVDMAGNIEEIKSSDFKIDQIPPMTMHSFSGDLGLNDWYISSGTYFLNAIDNTSGVNKTYYKIDSVEWTEYIVPGVLISDGIHTLEYYSNDIAGNIELVKGPFYFKIDQTPPVISLTKEKIGLNQVKFTAEVSDVTSGIDRVEFALDGVFQANDTQPPYEWTYTGFGDHTVTATAYDMAGNSQSQSMSTPYELIQGKTPNLLEFKQQLFMLKIGDQLLT